MLHLGLTLFGRRHVRCSQDGDGPDIYLQCRPGSLYMGGLTGPVHQVLMSSQKLHSPASDWGLGSVAVSSGVYLCSCVCLFVGPWSLACSSLWFPAGLLVTCSTVLYGLGVVAFTGGFSGGGMAICTRSVFGVVSVRICSCFRSCCFAGPARAGSEEMLHLPGPAAKQASVTIMMRTALFPLDRARLRNTTPSPIPVFQALSTAFREVLANHRFVLPTMDEVVSPLVA